MPTLMLELASASLPNPLQRLACLRSLSPLQMRLRHCLPSLPSQLLMLPHPCHLPSLHSCSAVTTPDASAPLPHLLLGLQSLHSYGALKLCLQHCPHLPYASSYLPLTIFMLVECLPDNPPMPLTILTLV
ncbi:hypothetical protein O181_075560 [Austropuccinia psidii MF-1]|uniref:Uncharacterized protein n=1 Tax=Austropuccinia psidii MF-1 TaxID=1389203 RepID=A0A9Q3F6W4_9BASI|nr:hypothetical protein [Austropuccinia psidii MF-1]